MKRALRWLAPRLRGPEPDVPRVHAAGLAWADVVALVLVTAFGLWLLAPGLGHPAIRDWDESIHQAVARGTLRTPLAPHLYADPLYPTDPARWWDAGVWLHKPPAPFWFAAAVMNVVGITPVAWRLGGLLGFLGAAWAVFLLARSTAGRLWALVAAAAFVALPFGWKLTQGFHFGDATDLTLTGWVALAMLWMVRGAERDRWGWWAAAGAAVGVAFLCKSALGLIPLGTAFLLLVGRATGKTGGPRVGHFVAMVGALLVVALPWNVYAALQWPAEFRASLAHTLGHVGGDAPAAVGPWQRPWDAVFNELNATELQPLPAILPLLAAVVLAIHAYRGRELPLVACAIWLWATWLIHAFMAVKVPAQVWSAVPAVFVAFAVLAVQSWRSAPTAVATLVALATPWLLQALPWLGALRRVFPPPFDQTRTQAGLGEGIVLCVVAAGATYALRRSRYLRPPVPPPHVHSVFDPKPPPTPRPEILTVRGFSMVAAGAVTSVAVVAALLWATPRALLSLRTSLEPESWVSHSAELGPALDAALPERAVLFQDFDGDPPGVHEVQALMFYSGRMVYRGKPDLVTTHGRGYHAYLISPVGERFEPVGNVPAHAWQRAYDPLKPLEPTPLPAGLHKLDLDADGLHLFGYAAGPLDRHTARYAFYVSPRGQTPDVLTIAFELASGERRVVRVPAEASLRRRDRLADVDWFILPALGPPLSEVRQLHFGATAPVTVAVDAAGR